ncbi:MAG: hypothetical protein WC050_02670 [Candidatus Paceibacterota bacterium]
MNATVGRDAFLWGFAIWFIGYLLGFIFFALLPAALIGWVVMPIGALITLWVLLEKITSDSLPHYALLAIIWTLIAIVLDYVFLVMLLKPADGYYKADVYLYYAFTFILPLVIGWYKATLRARS